MKKIICFCILFVGGVYLYAQTKVPAGDSIILDYYHLDKPLIFNNFEHKLAYSQWDNDQHYLQNYLIDGESMYNFTSMIKYEIITGKSFMKEMIANKTEELNQLKRKNPKINYQIFDKNGEFILSFTLYANVLNEDGKKREVAEYNIYRYRTVVDKKGLQYLILFAYTVRAYGAGISSFEGYLNKESQRLLTEMGNFKIPRVYLEKNIK